MQLEGGVVLVGIGQPCSSRLEVTGFAAKIEMLFRISLMEKEVGRFNSISLCGRHVLLPSHGRLGHVHGPWFRYARSGHGASKKHVRDSD